MEEGSVVLPTSLVGSLPQPDWLIDRGRLAGRFPPRVRARELWRVGSEFLEEALDDATDLAIVDQLRIGLDVVTDGEIRRESYSNRFATVLVGVDPDRTGSALDRSGHPNPVPRIIGPIERTGPIEVADLDFLRTRVVHTGALTKITLPGPFTMAQQAQNDYYPHRADLAFAYADAVREEIADLFAAGADVVQLDEPYLEARPEEARAYGLDALNAALEGASGTTAVHVCFGYAAIIHDRPPEYQILDALGRCRCDQISIETAQSKLDLSVLRDIPTKDIILGVIDLGDPRIETAHVVAERIRRAFDHVEPSRIVVAPDCGMKYLPRSTALGKLRAMVAGAELVRSEIGARAGAPDSELPIPTPLDDPDTRKQHHD